MAEFMQNLKTVIEENTNVCITENGAVAYKTTGKSLLDLNYKISSMRRMKEKEKRALLSAAYSEDKKLFVKWLFFAGDVRGGCGERDLFRLGLRVVAEKDPDIVKALLTLVPEYTRWDNLIALWDVKTIKDDITAVIKEQLNMDMGAMNAGESISLLAKWMPSVNTSSAETRAKAHWLAGALGLSDKDYRKMLSALRKYLDVVEVKLSSKRFGEVDYSAVPSKANIKYREAFLRNDYERRTEFLNKLRTGETTINGSVNFPHEVVHMYFRSDCDEDGNILEDPAVEFLWKALPDYVNGQGNTICVADSSGSMRERAGLSSSVTAQEVCNALTIYFSDHSSGQFKDKFITFSEDPEFVDLSSYKSLNGKLGEMFKHFEVANTNIERVFDMLLHTAAANNIPQGEIPNVLILSDMEFDMCAVKGDGSWGSRIHKKDFDIIRQKYENAGYKLPRLTFWNICSRTGAIPVKENDMGVGLVSGFSPAIVRMVLSSRLDPWEILMEQLSSERYKAVEDAIVNIPA